MTNRKWAFWCFFVALLVPTAFGLVYMAMPQVMPYHLAALGTDWAGVPPAYQIVLLTLMKATGAGMVSTGLAGGVILFIAFRRGEDWARWALFLITTVSALLFIWVTLMLQLESGAQVPWYGPVISLILVASGFLLSKQQDHASPG